MANSSKTLKVHGVNREADNQPELDRRVLRVHFNYEPTNEQMQEFMFYALAFRPSTDASG